MKTYTLIVNDEELAMGFTTEAAAVEKAIEVSKKYGVMVEIGISEVIVKKSKLYVVEF